MTDITNRQTALRVAGIYCLFGIAWILGSDTLLSNLVSDPDLRHAISLIKGWLYVGFTAFLLYLLILRELKLLEAAERSRRCAEELLQEVINQTPSVIYVFNQDGRFIQANKAMANLVGKNPEDLIGLTREEAGLSAESAKQHLQHDTMVLAEGIPVTLQEFNDEADGRHIYLTTKFPINNASAVCGISSDITQQVQQEEALRNARIAAEVAAQAKTVFLQTMSHELRTPLNGIAGGIQLLAMEPLSEDARSYLEMSRECTKNLTNLVSDILDMADIESNAIVLTDQPLHLPELFQSLEQLYQYAANKKGLKLEFSIDSAIPESVMADRTRLTQILSCLLSNACKFSQQGTVSVMVTQETRHEGETLLFNVRDQGIGIPEEQRQRIFDLFIQADGSITRSFEGTGLGLTLCKRLVELMGGRIWIDSAPDKGTTVWFTLPVRRESA